MSDSPTVVVRGSAIREVEPELAQLTIGVAARDKERQATLARLAARVEALNELLDEYGDAIDSRATSGFYVHPETKGARERVSAYTGTVNTVVTFKDFSRLGYVALALADQDQTTVTGPYWSLRPDSPAYREARRAAIDDALAKAHEYAEALGSRVLSLVELADQGLSGDGRAEQVSARAFRSGAPGGDVHLELDPQRQTVYAAVEARFTISEPTVIS
jgi:uncharacterized protein YggE